MPDSPSPITSRSEFHEALRAAFEAVATAGCKDIWISDADFADWPLGERAVVENLTRWAQAHRRFTVVAQRFDELARRHPRWVEWRRTWSHVVQCRTNTELGSGEMPTLFLAPGVVSVHLIDPVHHRGKVSSSAADALRYREMIDAVLQRSADAFPATTTGL